MLLRAKWIIPVEGRPIKNGAVRIERGLIAEVGSASSVEGTPTVDHGESVIIPGLVNAHTHLELTYCEGLTPPDTDFAAWLERVVASTATLTDADRTLAESAAEGMRRSVAAGTTTLGDVTSRPAIVRSALAHAPLTVVSFGEVIAVGTRRALLPERLQAAVDGSYVSDRLRIGVSPHAPYTIDGEGLAACLESASRLDLPLCMHVAESEAETRFTEFGDGPLRDFLERIGVWNDDVICPRLRPVSFADAHGVLGPRTILVHCNYVSDKEIRRLAATGTHVAFCPRTNAAFGHSPHACAAMLRTGVNVCLGTDSLASNPSLSILEEMRYLHGAPNSPGPTELLNMATLRGARALGLADRIGSLGLGKSADLAVVPLDGSGPVDPTENLVTSTWPVSAVYLQGRRAV